MKGKKIGYVRVSTFDQNADRQLDGITLDKKFIDKVSGKSLNRPELEALLSYVREDDTVIVHSMDRLARNLDDLRKLVKQLTDRNIKVQFIKENLIFTGEDSAMSQLLLSVMGAFAEFERKIIKERQMEGIALAKQRGAFKGRKPSLSDAQAQEMKERANHGESKASLAKHFKITRETVYQYLKKYI